MPRVFVTRHWPGESVLDTLRAEGHDVAIWPDADAPPADVLRAEAARSAVLVTTVEDRIDAAVLDAGAGVLRAVAQAGAGFDNIDVAAARARGVHVTNAPGVLDEATADLAFALALALARRLPEAEAYVRAGRWAGWHPSGFLGMDLHGATVGVVGLGRIGAAFARRCEGFGMRILYTATAPKPDADARGYAFRSLNNLLAESDIVSLHVPLTPATDALIGADALARMKPDALLVNTARGRVVDTAALLDALRAGHLRGVGLDVTDPEPLPAAHPLLGVERVLVVPHIGSASDRTRAALLRIAVENARAILAGEPAQTPV
jgi:glyoxylate reductase